MRTNDAQSVAPLRGLARVITLAPPAPGFIGHGHTAVHVIDSRDFVNSDPFIMLADDRFDLPPGHPAGGPHPHAGFEITTFAVEGEARDRDEGMLRAGDVLWMTAGSGVIHNEDFEPIGKLRILQLWSTLPGASRWAAPGFAYQAREHTAVRQSPGVEAHVYSGQSGVVEAPSHLHLPLTMVDVQMKPNTVFEQQLPSSYNGFLYPLQGELLVDGDVSRLIRVGQIGWLEFGRAATTVRLTAGSEGARVMLYAGESQNVPIVTHGPFVGEAPEDLTDVFKAYVEGRMPRVSELARQGFPEF